MSNETATKNVKVYETSIVPKGEEMVPARKHEMIASSIQIEVVHVLVFFIVLFGIFGGLWKSAVKAEKEEENKANSTGLNHK
ncbi:hypothetical protein BIY24_10805 [Halobacteriovorax marinus]|uniref:hypothetical protein n=1 Tax=Halobacteriovorax marinus TaxID=97084 RepID=UPI000BC2E832|nr:hypothetical protein [Halobacteriovorax marinus]ATH08420.1 hypothetical protein BIY24_10805 [Halobacteriovorax marinus]